MYAATGGENVKWGAQISNGGPGTTGPPLATTLSLCKVSPKTTTRGPNPAGEAISFGRKDILSIMKKKYI